MMSLKSFVREAGGSEVHASKSSCKCEAIVLLGMLKSEEVISLLGKECSEVMKVVTGCQYKTWATGKAHQVSLRPGRSWLGFCSHMHTCNSFTGFC